MPPSDTAPSSPARWLPWRSTWLAWSVTAVALAVGLPLFLRMPPWCDLTLYDIAAKNILAGGVHYRDVFDTNLPGFVWLLCGIRTVFGWSTEAVRAVDLVIVASITALMIRFAKNGGASRAATAWSIAGIAVFYPFTSEFNHCQRDIWMMLPALLAMWWRTSRLLAEPGTTGSILRAGAREGFFWALAVWIKPHIAAIALVLWLLTAPRVARSGWRAVLADLTGNVVAGLLVGAAGVAYLVQSGTWPHFMDVFEFWNQGYLELMWAELDLRSQIHFYYFVPWGYLQIVSLPLAALTVIDGQPWRRTPATIAGPVGRLLPSWLWDAGSGDAVRYWRMIFASLYLTWTAQAFYLQRPFHYVHIPEILLLLAFLATQRTLIGGFSTFVWVTITSIIVLVGWHPDETPSPGRAMDANVGVWNVLHPAANAERTAWWPNCFVFGLSERDALRRQDGAAMVKDFSSAIAWEELGEVADFLRPYQIHDREVLGWHDSPHAIVLLLNIRPGFRFQHVSHIQTVGECQDRRLWWEFCKVAPRFRFMVTDLLRVHVDNDKALPRVDEPGPTTPSERFPAFVPPGMHSDARYTFPYNVPAVFRSRNGVGRYLVHEFRQPVLECGPCN